MNAIIPSPVRERDLCECGRPVDTDFWADWCGLCQRHAGPVIAVNTWIPVARQLPAAFETVLLFNGHYHIVYNVGGIWFDQADHTAYPNQADLRAAHWQHLPAPPQ